MTETRRQKSEISKSVGASLCGLRSLRFARSRTEQRAWIKRQNEKNRDQKSAIRGPYGRWRMTMHGFNSDNEGKLAQALTEHEKDGVKNLGESLSFEGQKKAHARDPLLVGV